MSLPDFCLHIPIDERPVYVQYTLIKIYSYKQPSPWQQGLYILLK